MSCQQVPTAPALKPYPRSVQVGEFEVAISGGVWVAIRGVCYHAYTRYSEIHTGRATWGQFGLTVAVGAILLVVGLWLLTKATGVL